MRLRRPDHASRNQANKRLGLARKDMINDRAVEKVLEGEFNQPPRPVGGQHSGLAPMSAEYVVQRYGVVPGPRGKVGGNWWSLLTPAILRVEPDHCFATDLSFNNPHKPNCPWNAWPTARETETSRTLLDGFFKDALPQLSGQAVQIWKRHRFRHAERP